MFVCDGRLVLLHRTAYAAGKCRLIAIHYGCAAHAWVGGLSTRALLPVYWHGLPPDSNRAHRDETVSQKEVVWHSPAAQRA